MRWIFLTTIVSFGCRAKNIIEQRSVDTSTTATTDTGPDTDTGEIYTPPEEDFGPLGAWSSCEGTITLSKGDYTWQDGSGSCTINGPSTYADGTLTLNFEDLSRCEDVPWWLKLFDDGSAVFTPALGGTRLTLVPHSPLTSGQVAQFEEMLESESWELTTPEGYINQARLCFIEGTFFSGFYRNVSGHTEFLSDSGRIESQILGESGERWTTSCGGDCPCGGVVTIDTRSPDALTGVYHAYNCARIFEGSFTGTPL